MTVLIVPEVAYRPVGSRRPGAWNYHLGHSTPYNPEGIRTVCGLTLEEVETVEIGDVPVGKMCKQCLGAMKEKSDD
jgi:hypothetical protein